MLFWGPFAIAMLGAFGLQALLDRPELRRRAWQVLAAGALLALIAFVSLGP